MTVFSLTGLPRGSGPVVGVGEVVQQLLQYGAGVEPVAVRTHVRSDTGGLVGGHGPRGLAGIGFVDAFDAQGLGLMDGVGRLVGPSPPLLPVAVCVEEGVVVAGVGCVRRDGFRFRAYGFGVCRERRVAGFGGGAFRVGRGCRAGAHGGAVKLLEGEQGLGGRVERAAGDLPQVVLAVEMDTLAAVDVCGDGDGGVAVVGVGVDEEPAVLNVVVDLLRLVGHLAYLAAGEPGHRVTGPGPFLIYGFSEPGGDLDGHSVGLQVLGCLIGPVGLLVVDAG
ncbi:hypothetical protein [Streptomyces murinus]|uniref:hypothetical protein n=1 Tax=Streptomyces murinus TaxID=33900 RepID=UPI003827E529